MTLSRQVAMVLMVASLAGCTEFGGGFGGSTGGYGYPVNGGYSPNYGYRGPYPNYGYQGTYPVYGYGGHYPTTIYREEIYPLYGYQPVYPNYGYRPNYPRYGYRGNQPFYGYREGYPNHHYQERYPRYGQHGGSMGGGYRQPQWRPPMTQTQKDLNTIYDNRNRISRLPPQQQQRVIQRAQELQGQRARELDRYGQQRRGRW